MRAQLTSLWDQVQGSFWFVPGLISAAALLLAFATIALDSRLPAAWLDQLSLLFPGGPDSSRQVLAIIASSLITVGGVVFSIMVVSLTLASAQFGPYLLESFVRDRYNQVVLGTFVGTFIYCLIIMQVVDSGDTPFVPRISITIALVLTVVSLGVLVFFIHHIARHMQAPEIVADVYSHLIPAVDSQFPTAQPGAELQPPQNLLDRIDRNGCIVSSRTTGYLQALDEGRLFTLACHHDVVLQLQCRPGDFVLKNGPLLLIWPPERADPELVRTVVAAFAVGHRRTATQDLEFSIMQMVQIALRALSPSLNDPFTAIACIDYLGGTVAHMCTKPEFRRFQRQDDRLRIIRHSSDFRGWVDACFDQIRESASDHVDVLIRLVEVLTMIMPHTRTTEQRDAVIRQVLMVQRTIVHIPEAEDRRDLNDRISRFLHAVEMTCNPQAHP